MKWDEARRQCQADDADLASILNPYSQAYVTLQISKYNEPVWIGLNSNVVKHLPAIVCLSISICVKIPCNVLFCFKDRGKVQVGRWLADVFHQMGQE